MDNFIINVHFKYIVQLHFYLQMLIYIAYDIFEYTCFVYILKIHFKMYIQNVNKTCTLKKSILNVN